jgi:nucleotide-binding universal stress UspA family protein
MIAVDGSELDQPLASTAHRLFGDDAQYWAVNVRHQTDDAAVPASTTFPALYGGSFIGFGTVYPYLAPNPYDVRVTDVSDVTDVSGIVGSADATPDGATAAPGEPGPPTGATDGPTGDTELAVGGDPPAAILRAAHANAVDVIVVGDHDRSWWSKLIEPAVSDELIDRSEIPVLVVRAEAVEPVFEDQASS